MNRLLSVITAALITFSAPASVADDKGANRVPAGAVAFHFLGRFSVFPPPAGPQLLGYIAFLENVEGPFFDGTPGVETAHFTLTFTGGPPPVPLSPGSNMNVNLLPPGATFDVYFDDTPDQDWSDPASFSDGELVATFLESALLASSVNEPDGSGVAYNLFSSKLIYSKRFDFHGRKVSFRKLMRNGVTVNNFGSRTPVSFVPFTTAFSGSAVAIGGRPRD